MIRDDVKVSGLRLSSVIIGTGRPFLFLHGLCGNAEQSIELRPEVSDWQFLALESRGHGYSDIGDPASLSICQFAEDAAAYLHKLGSAPAVIGGISMGAAIALRLAVMQPELVCGLILARPAWVDRLAPANLAPHRQIAELITAHDTKEARQIFEATEMAATLASISPDNLNSLLSLFERRPLKQTQALLTTIAHDGPGISCDAISNIDVPTLVVGTSRDPIHPLAIAEKLVKLIKCASLIEITSKSDNRSAYVREFRAAIGQFLKEMA